MSTIDRALEKLAKKGSAKATQDLDVPDTDQVIEPDVDELKSNYSDDLNPEAFWDEVSPGGDSRQVDKKPVDETIDTKVLETTASESTPESIDAQSAGAVEADEATTISEPESEKAEQASEIVFKINFNHLDEESLLSPDSERIQMLEEFRAVKRPLLSNAFQEGPAALKRGNLIMVSSALPGEGKTFVSINLAISLAMEMDRTVLLVDADVAKPSVSRVLEIPPSNPGLIDVLDKKELELSDVLIRTNIENLTVLPAGRAHRFATELLASDSMFAMAQELSERYPDRLIIMDSPPLLLTSEAKVLAELVGQIVMVVEAESTSQNAVKDALEIIEFHPVVNLVLNKSRRRPTGGYYGGYGYNGRYKKS